MRISIVAALFSATFTLSAFAQTTAPNATPRIDKREARQESRIEQGKATGQLNNREAARLEAGQAKVDGMQTAAKADGKVTVAERKAIKREQNKQNRRIYKQKHDAQTKNPS